MKTCVIFYSRKEISDEQVGILKNHLSECLIFCNLDGMNLLDSHFWAGEDKENKIIVCGSKETLTAWAKQWTQVDSRGYDNKTKNVIFYISTQHLAEATQGEISFKKVAENITIDGYITYDVCKYSLSGTEFYQGKKSFLRRVAHEHRRIGKTLSKQLIRSINGKIEVISDNGEKKTYTYTIPNESTVPAQFYGVWLDDQNRAHVTASTGVSQYERVDFIYQSIKCSGFNYVYCGANWLFGDIREIVASREIVTTTKKDISSKEEQTATSREIEDFSSFDLVKADEPSKTSAFGEFASFDSVKAEKATVTNDIDEFGSFSTDKKKTTENKETECPKENAPQNTFEAINKTPVNDHSGFNESAVLLLLEENGIITTGLLQSKFKVTYGEAAKMILALSEKGCVVYTENGWVKNK